MAHSRHEQFIGADADSRLLMKAKRADHGVRNYRYTQTWRGIPVFGEGVVVSEDDAGNEGAERCRQAEIMHQGGRPDDREEAGDHEQFPLAEASNEAK